MNNNRINFRLDSSIWCCGLIEIGSFDQSGSGYFSPDSTKKFKSKEEVFKDFDTHLEDDLVAFVGEGGNNKGGQYLMQCTLVTKYGNGNPKGQFPELFDHLLASGWKKNREWVNMNTGNTVTQLQKLMTNKEAKAKYKKYIDE